MAPPRATSASWSEKVRLELEEFMLEEGSKESLTTVQTMLRDRPPLTYAQVLYPFKSVISSGSTTTTAGASDRKGEAEIDVEGMGGVEAEETEVSIDRSIDR